MCGIIGYVGHKNATEIVIESLKRLEYRGYDSAGIGIMEEKLSIFKDAGEIRELEKKIPDLKGKIGIGHTRWATHGRVSKENAHPHLSCDKKIAVVHNGIIENFKELKEELEEKGHTFLSETDTEVIVHLIEETYNGNLEEAVCKAIKKLKGSYALLIISEDEPDKIVGVRNESPLVVGIGDNENFIASDIPAFLKYTNRVKYLNDGEICIVKEDSVKIIDMEGNEIEREEAIIDWTIEDAEKAGFPHFMLKEIYEQPHSIAETMRGRISEVEPLIELNDFDIGDIEELTIVACGTSYYAGMAGKYILEEIAGIPANVELASEYRYFGKKRGTVIFITQSGETADVLAAVREAKKHGCKIMAITNVIGSTITRMADYVILTRAGPEIGVAATKTFTAQIVVLFLLALSFGMKKGAVQASELHDYIAGLHSLPSAVRKVLERADEIRKIAEFLKDCESVFFIGRGINYPIALEGALKLKEISYVHAEGFAAGELKHGPFALLTEETPVVAIVTRDKTYEKVLANIGEIKARNSPVIAVADEGDEEIEKHADFIIRFPSLPNFFACIPIAVILQLLAYHVANYRGCSIDKPRNLAKSVTVE